MAKPKVKFNHAEWAKLLKSDQMRPPLTQVAEKMASRARASAPVDSGDYRDGIRVESATTDRAVERIVAHDYKSSIIEARTGNLKRALGK